MSGIFISYRHADSADFSGRIFDHLRDHFGQSRVFRDTANIPAGSKFDAVIRDRIRAYQVFLVVIGPNWLEARNADGRPRLEAEGDYVAAEIAEALSQKKVIVPVLLGNQTMPTEEQLPENLRALASIQAISISDTRFDHDSGQLISLIEKHVRGRKRTDGAMC